MGDILDYQRRREDHFYDGDEDDYNRTSGRSRRRKDYLDRAVDDRAPGPMKGEFHRQEETAVVLSPTAGGRVANESEERRHDEGPLASSRTRDDRGRKQDLIIRDDGICTDDDDGGRGRSRRPRKHRKSRDRDRDRASSDKRDEPTGRCFWSEKERKDADFLERNFDSSYDGIIAAMAGASLGAMTANLFSEQKHRKRNIAGAALAGALSFNWAENKYARYVGDPEEWEPAKVMKKPK